MSHMTIAYLYDFAGLWGEGVVFLTESEAYWFGWAGGPVTTRDLSTSVYPPPLKAEVKGKHDQTLF